MRASWPVGAITGTHCCTATSPLTPPHGRQTNGVALPAALLCRVVFKPDTKVANAGTFTIQREDHTVGNLVRM